MLLQPCLLLCLVVVLPRSAAVVLHEQADVDVATYQSRTLGQYVGQQRCAGVEPIIDVLSASWQQSVGALGVEVSGTLACQHRHVHVAQHRQHASDAEWIVGLVLLAIANDALRLVEKLVDVSLDENVALHQHEAIWQQFPEPLHRHHVFGASELAPLGAADGAVALGIFFELLIEVDDLPLGVVDYFHASHLRCEWCAV